VLVVDLTPAMQVRLSLLRRLWLASVEMRECLLSHRSEVEGTADAPAQLDTLLQSVVPSERQRILLWSAGLQGQAACAILEYRGSQP
jgi:hypothetical protein